MEEWVNGLGQLMMTEVELAEVDGMTAAIAALNIDYVRTDRGIGPTCSV